MDDGEKLNNADKTLRVWKGIIKFHIVVDALALLAHVSKLYSRSLGDLKGPKCRTDRRIRETQHFLS